MSLFKSIIGMIGSVMQAGIRECRLFAGMHTYLIFFSLRVPPFLMNFAEMYKICQNGQTAVPVLGNTPHAVEIVQLQESQFRKMKGGHHEQGRVENTRRTNISFLFLIYYL